MALNSSGMSMSTLAVASGIPLTTLRRRLDDDSGLTIKELVKIASALDVPATDLLVVTVPQERAA